MVSPKIALAIAAVLFLTAPIASGELVAHWALDGSAVVANGFTGVPNTAGSTGSLSDLRAGADISLGLPSFSTTGGYDGGGYASFDGTNQGLVTYQNANAADILQVPFTTAMWIRATGHIDTGTGASPLATMVAITRTSANTNMRRVTMDYPTDGNLQVLRSGSDPYDVPGSFATLTDGSWHHVAVTHSLTISQTYIDGVLTISDPAIPTGTVQLSTPINAISIGCWYLSSGLTTNFWVGDIDEARLYNTELTAQEIAALAGIELVPGDFNTDGNVDGLDFSIWQMNFPTATEAGLGDGDADGDGDVDGADFIVWQTNFRVANSVQASTIPEPMSLYLILIATGLLISVAPLRKT
jgi:hypothetical protein